MHTQHTACMGQLECINAYAVHWTHTASVAQCLYCSVYSCNASTHGIHSMTWTCSGWNALMLTHCTGTAQICRIQHLKLRCYNTSVVPHKYQWSKHQCTYSRRRMESKCIDWYTVTWYQTYSLLPVAVDQLNTNHGLVGCVCWCQLHHLSTSVVSLHLIMRICQCQFSFSYHFIAHIQYSWV